MKNIYLTPTTNKDSILYKDSDGKINTHGETGDKCYLHIINNEKINEDNWFLDIELSVIKKCDGTYRGKPISEGIIYVNLDNVKKIIMTTDTYLINYGVQAIDDEFLEWFIKNPSCEFVEVEEIGPGFPAGIYWINYLPEHYDEIIIPKEEPKKEILGESFKEIVFKVPNNFNIKETTVVDMCMKEQQNIILTYRLGKFIEMINSLSDDTEKNRILKSVFNNEPGNLLLESYKKMKSFYEK